MSTDAEKLAQIAALCDEAKRVGFHTIYTASVRRILEEPGPVVPAVAFTRDRLRTELLASLPVDPKWVVWVDGVLDRLEATS